MRYSAHLAHLPRLCIAVFALLIAGCGSDSIYKRFPLTTPAWKSFDGTQTETSDTYVTATTYDEAGNSWRAFTDSGTVQSTWSIRKVDSQGVEIWRSAQSASITRLAVGDAGIVAVDKDNQVSFLNHNGAVMWQASPLGEFNWLQDLAIGSDGRILLAAFLNASDNKRPRIIALNNDGSVRWDHSFAGNSENLFALKLLENSVGETLVVEQYFSSPGTGVAIRTIDANGNVGTRNQIAGLNGGLDKKLWYRDGHILLQQVSGLFRLAENGTELWRYNPSSYSGHTLNCSQISDIRYACAYQTQEMETVVDWLDENGAVTLSRTYALDEPVDLLSDESGRLIMVEKRWPVFPGGNEDAYYMAGLRPSKLGTYRLHQLDENGDAVRTFNLLSGKVMPAIPSGFIPSEFLNHGEHYRHAHITPTQLIVSGYEYRRYGRQLVNYHSFVSGYALD